MVISKEFFTSGHTLKTTLNIESAEISLLLQHAWKL